MNGLIGLIAAVAIVSTASVAMAQPPPSGEFMDVDAKPVLDWSVPDRYAASWDAYHPATGYRRDFVNPSSWTLSLNGCASSAVRRITGYTFTVTQVGATWTQTRRTTACRLDLQTLPAQGLYSVKLVLHTDMGVAPGVSLPASRFASIRDIVIVSMGDSLASGEGNPDVPGLYGIGEVRPVQWKDRRCHRSAKSGPSLAAKAYEDSSPHTSVTFLSVACSGAELPHLFNTPYAGSEPNGTMLAPQVEQVRSLVERPIDALLISAGVNDLGFSDIIERCVRNTNVVPGHQGCVTEGGLADKIYGLRSQYAQLALVVAFGLPQTREIYLSDYPSSVFVGGACGKLAGSLPGLGIDALEGQEMDIQGTALNAKITQATDAFREYRWNRIGPLDTSFRTHGYCADDSWFTSYEKSMTTQGNAQGTAHPNAAGHVAYGNLIRQAMVPTQGSTPFRKLTVTIEAVKSTSVGVINPVLWRYQNDPYGQMLPLSVPQNGQWTPVPASAGTFTLDVFVAPASPRHAIELRITLAGMLPIHHVRDDGFGAGLHEVVHPTGTLAVRYRVDAQSVGPPGVGH